MQNLHCSHSKSGFKLCKNTVASLDADFQQLALVQNF